MANRWLESFDYLATADLTKRYVTVAGGGNISVSSSNGRNSTSSLRTINNSAGLDIGLSAQATWIVGLAHKASTVSVLRQVAALLDGTTVHVTIGISASGNLVVYRGNFTTLLATGATTLSASTFYYIEFKITISDTVGVVQAQINGASETFTFVTGNASNQDTRNGGNATANIVQIGQGSGLAGTFDYDDIYVNDGTGGVDDDFWGDVRIIDKTVDGAGNYSQFTPSTGSNWQNVDDSTPDGDTTYNETSTVNNIDTGTTAALGVTGTVKGVNVLLYARKSDAGAGSLAPLWRISSTDYAGTGVALSTDYIYVSQLYRVSPATSSAWTTTELDGAEVGYKRTA